MACVACNVILDGDVVRVLCDSCEYHWMHLTCYPGTLSGRLICVVCNGQGQALRGKVIEQIVAPVSTESSKESSSGEEHGGCDMSRSCMDVGNPKHDTVYLGSDEKTKSGYVDKSFAGNEGYLDDTTGEFWPNGSAGTCPTNLRSQAEVLALGNMAEAANMKGN